MFSARNEATQLGPDLTGVEGDKPLKMRPQGKYTSLVIAKKYPLTGRNILEILGLAGMCDRLRKTTCVAPGSAGFTVMELIIVMALMAILAAVGAPSLMSTLRNNESITQVNDFIAALHLARSTAVTQRKPVTVCASNDGATCTGTTNWASGYIVLNGANVIRAHTVFDGGPTFQDAASAHTFTFNGYGEASSALQFTHTPANCTAGAGTSKRTVSVEVTGRVNTATAACP